MIVNHHNRAPDLSDTATLRSLWRGGLRGLPRWIAETWRPRNPFRDAAGVAFSAEARSVEAGAVLQPPASRQGEPSVDLERVSM